jgi:hypothetical protein
MATEMQSLDVIELDGISCELRDTLNALFRGIQDIVSGVAPSRPASLCMTKLDEASMWASIALREAQKSRALE